MTGRPASLPLACVLVWIGGLRVSTPGFVEGKWETISDLQTTNQRDAEKARRFTSKHHMGKALPPLTVIPSPPRSSPACEPRVCEAQMKKDQKMIPGMAQPADLKIWVKRGTPQSGGVSCWFPFRTPKKATLQTDPVQWSGSIERAGLRVFESCPPRLRSIRSLEWRSRQRPGGMRLRR